MIITDSIKAFVTAARQLLTNWSALVLLALLYLALLATLYLFASTREASIGQVVATFALALAAPLLFFLLQTVSAISTQETLKPQTLIKRSLTEFWKLFVVSLPVLLLAALVAYLVGKLQLRLGADIKDAVLPTLTNLDPNAKPPLQWGQVWLTALRYLVFGVVFPLLLMQLWLATARDGLKGAFIRARNTFGRAFAPQSVLIYMAGFVIFGLAPFLLLFQPLPAKRPWLELGLLGGRLALAFLLSLFGWVLTMGALASSAYRPAAGEPEAAASPLPAGDPEVL